MSQTRFVITTIIFRQLVYFSLSRLSVSPPVCYKHWLAMFFTSARASTKVQRCSRSLQTLRGRTRDQLRQLLRETAQPVAVVMTPLEGSTPISTRNATQSAYHGATLSLLTFIAFGPYPLVAFSLCVPSRTAAALNSHVDRTQADAESLNASHMVINILSAALSKFRCHVFESRPPPASVRGVSCAMNQVRRWTPYHLGFTGFPFMCVSISFVTAWKFTMVTKMPYTDCHEMKREWIYHRGKSRAVLLRCCSSRECCVSSMFPR